MAKNATKRALISSALALLVCVSMLIGTTFAWFTDSVTSTNNIIKSGNLDVELWWSTDAKTWTEVDANTNVFTDQLWEPGHTEVVYLKVKNAGTLALKYNLGINVASETTGINVDNEPFKLSDYIMYGTADVANYTRETAIAAVEANAIKLNVPTNKNGSLEAGQEYTTTMVVYMPTTVGNEANYKTGTNAPVINLGINLFATQYTFESDSFGNDYDEEAAWTGIADTSWYNDQATEFTLTNAEELAGLAQLVNAGNTFAGKTIKLGGNIDLNNVNWTPIGTKSAEGEKAFSRTFAGSFDGQGYTVSNLRVVGGNALGLFGRTGTGTHIEDLNIVNAYVSGTDYVGAIAGYAYLSANCIKNCTVTNATIIATPFQLDNGEYDGGAKAGAIVGYALNGNLIGNTVKDSTVVAYRDLGAIAGMLAGDGIKDRTLTAEDNNVQNVVLSYTSIAGTYAEGKVNENMNDVVGRVGSKSSVGTNTVGTVTKDEGNKGITLINNIDELIAFANTVNSGVTYAGKTVKLNADIDLANMEWTPIGIGSGFYGTFDGNGKTISNLKVTGYNSTVGLFANTYNGEIKNLTVKNASVSGRLNVGVVAGNPYTSKYTNIKVTGHVEVNGMAYVGGVGGKNAYANWTDITVDVDETSYVNAVSTENGTNYRTYVGGVVGFNGEGGHTFKNITTNIDVIGNVLDIGGAFGIAHYGNKFENITVTGDVTGPSDEIGGIAGVWNNGGSDVIFTSCKFEGTINSTDSTDVSNNTITGAPYSATGKGSLIIDGVKATTTGDAKSLDEILINGGNALLTSNLKINSSETTANSGYGATGISVKGGVLDGNGHSFGINNWGTWDAAIHTTGGTIKNVTVNSGMRGIFMGSATSDVYIDNVVIDGTIYTFNSDGGDKNYGVYISNSTLNGWTSHSDVHKEVVYTNCSFGEGQGYAFCRPYGPTSFVGCDFEAGFEVEAIGAVTFENCTIGGVALTAENLATLVIGGIENATVK